MGPVAWSKIKHSLGQGIQLGHRLQGLAGMLLMPGLERGFGSGLKVKKFSAVLHSLSLLAQCPCCRQSAFADPLALRPLSVGIA